MGTAGLLILVFIVLEHHLPFRGLMTDQVAESIKEYGFKHYVVGWLPTWWFILACSMLSAGVGLGCSVWAVVGEIQGQPTGVPILIGAASLVSAFAGLLVPIVTAWFKDRAEERHTEELKNRVHELEMQVQRNREDHQENALNIQKVTLATQKIADAAEKILEAKQHIIEAETKKDQPEQDT